MPYHNSVAKSALIPRKFSGISSSKYPSLFISISFLGFVIHYFTNYFDDYLKYKFSFENNEEFIFNTKNKLNLKHFINFKIQICSAIR